jgi:hypothetical protein
LLLQQLLHAHVLLREQQQRSWAAVKARFPM